MASGPAGVDWDDEVRGERRRQLLVLLALPALPLGALLLTGRFLGLSGRSGWLAGAVYVALLPMLAAASSLVPRWRASRERGSRMTVALRHHVDPGPDLRSRVDRMAVAQARIGWMWPFVPLGLVGLLSGARWDRPAAAATGSALLATLVVAWSVWWFRWTRSARRWLADPPGPTRELPPLTTLQRWLTGPRALLLFSGLAVAAVLVSLLIVALR